MLAHVERLLLGRVTSATDALRDWSPDPSGAFCGRCGGSIGPAEAGPDGCSACRGVRLAWSDALRLGRHDGALQDAIIALKFGGERPAGRVLGRMLGERLASRLGAASVPVESARIVPVPTTQRRRVLRGRGVDHVGTIARWASVTSGVAVVRGLRRRHGPPQTGQTSAARRRAIRSDVFRWTGHEVGDGIRCLIILDDVRTTGATLTACCRAVRRGWDGAAVRPALWVATASVSDAGDRRSGGGEVAVGGKFVAPRA